MKNLDIPYFCCHYQTWSERRIEIFCPLIATLPNSFQELCLVLFIKIFLISRHQLLLLLIASWHRILLLQLRFHVLLFFICISIWTNNISNCTFKINGKEFIHVAPEGLRLLSSTAMVYFWHIILRMYKLSMNTFSFIWSYF